MDLYTSLEKEQGVNLLSCDAGSIASLMTSIRMIEELMGRIQKELGLPEPPRPNRHFKLMAGAGFSGQVYLLVIMLGRLGMSVEEAKMQCLTIINEVFPYKKWLRRTARFKAARLEAVVKRMLESHGETADARMIDARKSDSEGCKVMVCVAPAIGMRAGLPAYLRTYPVDRNSVPDCTIVEAVRATFSVPGLFKPTEVIEPGGLKVSYIGLSDSNPTGLLLEEVANIFPDGSVKCIISIGTEQHRTAECERTANEISARFQHVPGVYFRFGLDQETVQFELADWRKLSLAVVKTRSYLLLSENDRRMSELARALTSRKDLVSTKNLKGAVPAGLATGQLIKCCPPPSQLFTGRLIELALIERCLADGSTKRCVFVLYGLGGAGKTQLALRFAALHRKMYKDIFYIDATSSKTIEADLKSIAVSKRSGDCSDDALTWLARMSEEWLIVYNNADDVTLDLRRYIPACSHGKILITTRNRRMIVLAQGVDPHCHVSELSAEDAQRLLAKAAGVPEDICHAGKALVKELGYFALAIVQAGAYIRTHCCVIRDYLDMYLASRGQLLEDYARLVPKIDNYDLTVYATWRVSYLRLKPLERQLYDILVFLHHERISENIFRFAALGLREFRSDIPLTNTEILKVQKVSELLANFQLDNGDWDKSAFLRSIDELQAYSLVNFDISSQSYSIHPLVQQWTRTTIHDSQTACSCAAILVSSSVMDYFAAEDYEFRRLLLNHAEVLPKEQILRPWLAGRIRLIYHEAGRYEDEQLLLKTVTDTRTSLFGKKHPATLENMSNLADTYKGLGKLSEAEVLQQEVLTIRKETLGNEHAHTLTSMASLASIFWEQGRWKEAETLHRRAYEVRKRVLVDHHPSTLESMTDLANILLEQGIWKEAEELKQELVNIRKQTLGDDHPNTLFSIHNLARAYRGQGRWKEAEVLDCVVVEGRKRVLGNDHPDTLMSMNNLAATYWNQGQWREAEVLQLEVLERIKRVRGYKHPETLRAMGNLAVTYRDQGRYQESEVLQRDTLKLREYVLGKVHPDTLISMHCLSRVYWSQGRLHEANDTGKQTLELRQQNLGDDHPDTLKSVSNLAVIQRDLGQLLEAEEMMAAVVETSKRVLGDSHPHVAERSKQLTEIKQLRESREMET